MKLTIPKTCHFSFFPFSYGQETLLQKGGLIARLLVFNIFIPSHVKACMQTIAVSLLYISISLLGSLYDKLYRQNRMHATKKSPLLQLFRKQCFAVHVFVLTVIRQIVIML